MFCPQCRAEYREGIVECPECAVPLVAALAEDEAGEPDVRLVSVFSTGEADLLPVVHSLLESAGIEYFAKNEGAQDILGFGRLGTNYSYAAGPVDFMVREEDEAAARGALEELATATPEDAEGPGGAGTAE